jgi:hypothetical protein
MCPSTSDTFFNALIMLKKGKAVNNPASQLQLLPGQFALKITPCVTSQEVSRHTQGVHLGRF